MSNVVRLENLWFSYRQGTAIEDVSLALPERTFLGVIGPNGAGKTTLIRLIMGLIKPTSGSVAVFDRDPETVSERIGYVPQHPPYDITFPITTLDVVLMSRLSKRSFFGGYRTDEIGAALDALRTVKMEEYRGRQIGSLSTGQRQRVLLARAIATDPGLLILDEPLSGVDVCLEFEFYDLLNHLKEKMSIILVSHDIGVVSHHVDEIACLNRRLYYHGAKEAAMASLDKVYGCPVDVIAHGVPHRVLREHQKDGNS
jgi:zinc transport system ATP-binding protein